MPILTHMLPVVIHSIHTSPGHNYFGRHGMEPERHAILSHDAVELVAGMGIPGDRFYGWKENYKGQVTLIDLAIVEDVRRHAGNPELPASAFRRNFVVSGVDLNSLVGKVFRFGDVLLEGASKCKPCYWMDEACGRAGTEALMHDRGGLRCRILESGRIRIGETTLEVLREAAPAT